MSPRTKLQAFVRRRLERWGSDPGGPAATLLREVERCVGPLLPREEWQRRPSISRDGMPVVLSTKLTPDGSESLRLLVEPGSLRMSVAQQIAFSLTTLDRMLGALSWRTAAEDVNCVTRHVFPSDAASTASWWGGIWLGASVEPGAAPELRLYLNLRHGNADARWQTVAAMLSEFAEASEAGALEQWFGAVSPHAIPVGVGVVIAAGRMRALRIYAGAHDPTASSLAALCRPVSTRPEATLDTVCTDFIEAFGPMQSQAVTVGYDFVRVGDGAFLPGIGRVKVDIACDLTGEEGRPLMRSWVARTIAASALDPSTLGSFFDDVDTVWGGCDVQFLSLGFAPDLAHATVYAKPF